SKASTLEVHEMQYLLSEVKAKDIMTGNPVTVHPEDSIAQVASLMLEKKIGGLPVVDETGHLVGVITDQDIFKVFVDISGARVRGIDITIECSDEPGTLAYLLDIILRYNGRIISVLTSFLESGDRHVFLRMHPLEDPSRAAALRAELEAKTKILEWVE
ncbi:MAG: CBS domain-containing protein, partial [Desulfovibrionaceae bacterium]|nr:CBS domain-containing protein [Desulfovibrionaceae bacterium]